MKTNSHARILKLTQVAFLSALIVLLQVMTYFIKLGPFNMSFVLVPVVIGGIMLGTKYGTILGGVFGLVVTVVSAIGLDAGGAIVFAANPFLCALTCIGKGVLAGFVPAVVYHAIAPKLNNKIPAMIIAAVLAPVCNTFTFCFAMFFLFNDVLVSWAGGTNVMLYMITGLVGINFLFELLLNVILCPVIGSQVVKGVKKEK